MALPASTHTTVKAETKRIRNAAARARRGAMPGKYTSVALYDAVSRRDGTRVLFAVSTAMPYQAFIVTQDETGGWRCTCTNYRLTRLGSCAHTRAAEAAEREAA